MGGNSTRKGTGTRARQDLGHNEKEINQGTDLVSR